MSARDSTAETGVSFLDDDRVPDVQSVPWLPAIVTGAVTWLLGYVLMVGLIVIGPASIQAPSRSAWLKQVGYIFYNAQFVDGVITAPSDVLVPGGRRINFILQSADPGLPIPIYFAVPVLAILVGGVVLGRTFLEPGAYSSAGLAGIAMAGGYLTIAILGTLVIVRTTGDGVATFGPDRLQTAALGIAYPFVVGTIGALAGMSLGRET